MSSTISVNELVPAELRARLDVAAEDVKNLVRHTAATIARVRGAWNDFNALGLPAVDDVRGQAMDSTGYGEIVSLLVLVQDLCGDLLEDETDRPPTETIVRRLADAVPMRERYADLLAG